MPALENHIGYIVAAFEELTASDLVGFDVEDGGLPCLRLFARIETGGDCEKVELGEERHVVVLDEHLEKLILVLEAMDSILSYSPISELS